MKARLEKIEPGFGSSFKVQKFTDAQYFGSPQWHFHPEYEIVYISNGRGKRHIGNHFSYYEEGDLIFLGPNLPHFGFTEELFEEHVEIVVQMKEDFLGQGFLLRPELADIRQLFERSKKGLSFSGQLKREVGWELEQLPDLDHFDRLISLLNVLKKMAGSEEYEPLNADGFIMEVNSRDHERVKTIYTYVEKHFQGHISLEEVARRTNMTVPAFCRYFKKLTHKTFTRFVNEFRIAHACRLLAVEHLSITGVSFESGFNNLSHFNKLFKTVTGFSPREYRKNLKRLVG